MAKRITKKDIYKEFGIEYKAGKILSPIGFINPLLVNGNSKIGDGVYHFSMLAGKKEYKANIDGDVVSVFGTCGDDCFGCYGMTGNYNYQSVIDSLAVKTVLAREYLEFVERAITAQIKADNIKTVRIHATGDFFSREYLNMWERIIAKNPAVVFWSYTKEYAAETAFDKYDNANIVKSMIPGANYNYGKAEYVIAVYNLLKGMGKEVYVCRCGIDKDQHCTNCKACALCEHVLFLEHSTGYKPEKDPAFPAFKALVDSQGDKYLN